MVNIYIITVILVLLSLNNSIFLPRNFLRMGWEMWCGTCSTLTPTLKKCGTRWQRCCTSTVCETQSSARQRASCANIYCCLLWPSLHGAVLVLLVLEMDPHHPILVDVGQHHLQIRWFVGECLCQCCRSGLLGNVCLIFIKDSWSLRVFKKENILSYKFQDPS